MKLKLTRCVIISFSVLFNVTHSILENSTASKNIYWVLSLLINELWTENGITLLVWMERPTWFIETRFYIFWTRRHSGAHLPVIDFDPKRWMSKFTMFISLFHGHVKTIETHANAKLMKWSYFIIKPTNNHQFVHHLSLVGWHEFERHSINFDATDNFDTRKDQRYEPFTNFNLYKMYSKNWHISYICR